MLIGMIAATQYYYQLCGSAVERLTAEKNIGKGKKYLTLFLPIVSPYHVF